MDYHVLERITNLSYVKILVEKMAINRFHGHAEVNDLDVLLQSAYKEHHSVKTALVKVYDDLLCAMDNKKMILMTLLDLSMAFDTVDHMIRINRLERCFGNAIEWMKSYFCNQHKFVSINGAN